MRHLSILALALLVCGCDLRYALLGFPAPAVRLSATLPLELEYREAKGGLVVLRGRVNSRADVDFILDTGAPVTVLLDGPRTAGLGLDSSKARPLGDPGNPAVPVGDIQDGYTLQFGALSLSQLTAVVIPEKGMPCRERFDEINFGGVVGADLFRQFVVEVDTAARRVRIHDPKVWSPPAGSAVLPLTFRRGHPYVEATLTLADGRSIPAGMNVDIGMNRALTVVAGSHPALAMPADGKPRKSCYVNGVQEEREGAPLSVSLAGVTMEVPVPIYSASPNVVDGERTSTIGIGLFSGRRFFVDYPGKRLVLLK